MQYQEFITSASARRRYWARNFVGWPQFSACLPNASHHALRAWQKGGKVSGLVTQNVDALHTKAGSEDVVELHGCSYRVVGNQFFFKQLHLLKLPFPYKKKRNYTAN